MRDININSTNEDGTTALMTAVYKGFKGIVKLMLGQPNIDINRVDKYGFSALVLAACGGHGDMFGLLLAYSSKIFAETMFRDSNLLKDLKIMP